MFEKLLGAPVVGLVNTVVSVFARKTNDATDSVIHEKVKNGIQVSSKKLLNIGVTSGVIAVALADISANGIVLKGNVVLLLIGVVYAVCMSYIQMKAEK